MRQRFGRLRAGRKRYRNRAGLKPIHYSSVLALEQALKANKVDPKAEKDQLLLAINLDIQRLLDEMPRSFGAKDDTAGYILEGPPELVASVSFALRWLCVRLCATSEAEAVYKLIKFYEVCTGTKLAEGVDYAPEVDIPINYRKPIDGKEDEQ